MAQHAEKQHAVFCSMNLRFIELTGMLLLVKAQQRWFL